VVLPTIGPAIAARVPWLIYSCPACQHVGSVDLRTLDRHPAASISEHIDSDGAKVFQHACRLGLEGIVAKRQDRSYRSGRSTDWIKIKNPNAPAVNRLVAGSNPARGAKQIKYLDAKSTFSEVN
jgi:ATP-dependent DNA ligase